MVRSGIARHCTCISGDCNVKLFPGFIFTTGPKLPAAVGLRRRGGRVLRGPWVNLVSSSNSQEAILVLAKIQPCKQCVCDSHYRSGSVRFKYTAIFDKRVIALQMIGQYSSFSMLLQEVSENGPAYSFMPMQSLRSLGIFFRDLCSRWTDGIGSLGSEPACTYLRSVLF